MAESIREMIRGRRLRGGDALPSERVLAGLLGANHLTVRKALRLLEGEGVIHTVPSRGSFVGRPLAPHGKTGLLGFVFPDEEVFFFEILSDLERKSEPLGLHLIVHVTQGSGKKEARVLDYFKELPLAGVIAAPNIPTAHLYQNLRCPVVFFDTWIKDLPIPQITTDDTRGSRLAVEHLIQLGHRRIAYIGGIGEPTSQLRLDGYLNALGAHGIKIQPRLIQRRDYSRDWGYAATQALFQSKASPPTALFCGNDTLAAAALHGLKHLGIPCPQAVSVVGFGNTEIAPDLNLTTVDQDRSKIVDAILQKLRALLNGEAPHPTTRIPTEPVLRGTTAPCSFIRNKSGGRR